MCIVLVLCIVLINTLSFHLTVRQIVPLIWLVIKRHTNVHYYHYVTTTTTNTNTITNAVSNNDSNNRITIVGVVVRRKPTTAVMKMKSESNKNNAYFTYLTLVPVIQFSSFWHSRNKHLVAESQCYNDGVVWLSFCLPPSLLHIIQHSAHLKPVY